MYYLAVAHYARESHRPIMFLTQPADAAAERRLSKFPKLWLIGPNAGQDGPVYLPGWNVLFNRGFPNSGTFAEMEKNTAAAGVNGLWPKSSGRQHANSTFCKGPEQIGDVRRSIVRFLSSGFCVRLKPS